MTVRFENGNTARFWFSYEYTTTVAHCLVDEKEFVALGSLSVSDRFCKATGRRVALNRLLLRGGFRTTVFPDVFQPSFIAKADRRLVWQQYFKEHADLRHAKKHKGASA